MFGILKADSAVNYYNFVNSGKFRCFGTVLAHSICYNGSKSLIILLIPDWYYSAYESKNEVETMKPNTRKAIKESFMLLLNQKPLSKITVKEIVANCGINRNSFYYHYSDIPTLLEEILIEKADAIFNPEINGNICGCMTAAVRVALDNKNAMMHIFNSANRESFERSLDRMAERAVSNCIDFYAAVYTISDECREAVLLYYKSLLVGFAIDWLNDGMSNEISDRLKCICVIFDGTFENMMRNCGRIS